MNPKTEPVSETQKALHQALEVLEGMKGLRNNLRYVTGDTRLVWDFSDKLERMGRALSRLAAEVEGK